MNAPIPATPLNTEWNRKANILEGAGKAQLLETKNGNAYFTWTDLERGTIYLQCEQGFFDKNFKTPVVTVEQAAEPAKVEVPAEAKKPVYKKYPFDLIKK